MDMLGGNFLGGLFDLNGDGVLDSSEEYMAYRMIMGEDEEKEDSDEDLWDDIDDDLDDERDDDFYNDFDEKDFE